MSSIRSTLLQVKSCLVDLQALYQRETADIAKNRSSSQTNQSNDRTTFVQQAKVLYDKQKRLVKAFELSKRLSAAVEQSDVELSCDSQIDLFIERRCTRSTATNVIGARSTAPTIRCANTATSVRGSQTNKIPSRMTEIKGLEEDRAESSCSLPSTNVQHRKKKVEEGIGFLNCSDELVPSKRQRTGNLEIEAASKSQCSSQSVGMHGALVSKNNTTGLYTEPYVNGFVTENVEYPSTTILAREVSTADVTNTSSLPHPCSPVVSSAPLMSRIKVSRPPLSLPLEEFEQIVCLSSPEDSPTILPSVPAVAPLPLVTCGTPAFSGTLPCSQDVPLWKRMGLPPPPPSPSSVSSCSPHLQMTRLTSLQKEGKDCFETLSNWTSKEIPVQCRQQMPLKKPVASKELTTQKPDHSRQLAGNGTVSQWLATLPVCTARIPIATFKKPSIGAVEKCRSKAVPRCYPSVVVVTHNAISSVAGSAIRHFTTTTSTDSLRQERSTNVHSQASVKPMTTLTTTSVGKTNSKVIVKTAAGRRGLKQLLADKVIQPGSSVMSLISPVSTAVGL